MLKRRWVVSLVCAGVFGTVRPPALAQYCAYVTSGNAVSVIDASTNTVAATIPVGLL